MIFRTRLTKLAIPFSGYGIAGPLTPAGRRLRAFQELISLGSRCPMERWLDARAPTETGPPLFDLRVALAALGVGRIDQLATLDLEGVIDDGHYALPVRQGLIDADRDREARVSQRRVPAEDLEELIADTGRADFGGAGAGVQVLGVVEARGRTFEHLFLLGLNRGVFPRTVQEDPVLPDRLRRQLSLSGHGVLADLPIKRRGYEEERYLFAHLLSSSPKVTLSWLELDDNHRAATPSPLVERVRWTHPKRPDEWRAPRIVGRHPVVDVEDNGAPPQSRLEHLPMEDHAVLAGLHARETGCPAP